MELKILNRYALSDLVHSSQWQTKDYEITIHARFAGSSADGTIHFHLSRWRDRSQQGTFVPVIGPPRQPERFDVHVSTPSGSQVAVATWRCGNKNEEVEYAYYAIGDQGELLEVEPPTQESSKPQVGFRHQIEKKTD